MVTTKAVIFVLWSTSQIATAPFASGPVLARDRSGAFLDRFVGTFSGQGTVRRIRQGDKRAISCKVTGKRPNGDTLTIKGSCGVFIFRSGINATIRYHPATGHYTGLWQDWKSTSDLSGRRSGNTLKLRISKRGGAAKAGSKGQMVVRSLGSNRFKLIVSTIGQAARPQRVEVTLKKS